MNYALKFDGLIEIRKTGVYIFTTRSDDGTRLFIDDSLIVDNGGVHGVRDRQGAVALEKGYHPIALTFFQGVGEQYLEVFFEGPSGERKTIPAGDLAH